MSTPARSPLPPSHMAVHPGRSLFQDTGLGMMSVDEQSPSRSVGYRPYLLLSLTSNTPDHLFVLRLARPQDEQRRQPRDDRLRPGRAQPQLFSTQSKEGGRGAARCRYRWCEELTSSFFELEAPP